MTYWPVKLFALDRTDRDLLFKIISMLPLTTLGLRIFGFKRVFSALYRQARSSSKQRVEDKEAFVGQARYWIRYAKLHGPYRGNCLSRSLVLWWLLQRQGIETVFRIGIRKHTEEIQAHAWIEYRNQPVNAGPRVHQRYSSFNHVFSPNSVQKQHHL